MNVGFTGTQEGMTDSQKESVTLLLKAASDLEWIFGEPVFHHGDCIGSDAEADEIARELGYAIVVHPPLRNEKRAFVPADGVTYRKPKDYLDRNQDIVDETDLLLATPQGFEEERRSGTWATIRRSRGRNMRTIIVWPDGTYSEENMGKALGDSSS